MRLPQRLLAFFLSFVLIFISTPSFAADPNDFRKPNQWQRERTINDAINKSSVKVEAQRTYPVSTLGPDGKPIKQIRNAKATITLGAASGNVAKSLFKRVPAIAIQSAVIAILGKSVDWVMDKENNSVKYMGTDFPDYITNGIQATKARGPAASCKLAESMYGPNHKDSTYKGLNSDSAGNYYCAVSGSGMWDRGFNVTPVDSAPAWVHIPINQVADEIINQANAGDAPAMQVMNDAAIDALEAGLLDAQLDAASDIPQPDPEEIPDTDPNPDPNPDPDPDPDPDKECPAGYKKQSDGTCLKTEQTPSELPPFCSWASKVCDFIDWYQKDSPDDTEIELPEPDMPDVDTDIDFGGSCPPDLSVPFNLYGTSTDFVLMPFSKFCPLLESYIRPVLILLGSFMAVTIVGGRRDG